MDTVELLKGLGSAIPIEGRQSTDKKKTLKGYDTDGYGYQYCVNRFNDVLGELWGFTWNIITTKEGSTAKGKYQIEIVVKVEIWVNNKENERSCVGGHISTNYTDALKGAITSGFKKTAAFWGVGRHAYEGSIDTAYIDDDNKPFPEGWNGGSNKSAGDNDEQQQGPTSNKEEPIKQATKPTNGNDNVKKSTVHMGTLFGQFRSLNLETKYTVEDYKAYCYNKYSVGSMKDLTSKQLEEQNNILGVTIDNPDRIEKFKKILDDLKQSKPDENSDEKQALIKKIVDNLSSICGQDNDTIGYELSRMCTQVSHPGDLSKLTLAQLQSIDEMVNIKMENLRVAS